MLKNYRRVLAGAAFLIILALAALLTKANLFWGLTVWSIILFAALLCGKKSVFQSATIDTLQKKDYLAISVFVILLIALCILPMDLASFWNGRIPMHRNQYELLADSIMNGHLYIDYDDIDPNLLAMDNPYDYEARLANQILYHWDHAFYNGHYYMYFGVVPVFLLFIPFKLIFGKTLVTFHATQFFVMMGIIAFFLLFYMMAKKFFPKLTLGTYLFASAAISLITMGYCVQAPALYCTAISGAICLELWSLVFFFLAVYFAKSAKLQVAAAVLGALAGALAFGCRPPVALGNLIAIPLAITYVKDHKGKGLIAKFIAVCVPYAVVAALLMLYNYVRFESPFEFGQAYQLTSYDQSMYSSFFGRITVMDILNGFYDNFLTLEHYTNTFPYFRYGGFLVTYPLMWLIVPLLSHDSLRARVKEDKAGLLALFLVLTPFIITILQIQWSPGLCERYRLDAYYLVGILAFMLIGFRMKTKEKAENYLLLVRSFALISILMTILIFFQPLDANFATEYPEKVEKILEIITFGLAS